MSPKFFCKISINILTRRAKYLLKVSLFTIKNELIPKHKVERKRITLELLSIDNPEFNKISANHQFRKQ